MLVKTYLDEQDISRMEAVASTPRNRLLIRLPYRLGCRVSEALGITVDGIDFVLGKVSIVHLKYRVWLSCRKCNARLGLKHEFCPRCGTKNELNTSQRAERRRQRLLPVDEETLNLMRDFIEAGGPVEQDGRLYLFGINRHRAWQIVRECARRAGVPNLVNPETGKPWGVSPHRLRDAFAVRAMKTDDSGEGMRLLQEHLGHASFNTTAKYRKIAGEEHKTWYDKLWKNACER
jgi:integrase/recombinase XerD